jgi:hypothetical protein
MATQQYPVSPTCPICHKPIEIESSKADEDGHAVHKDCYFLKVKTRNNTTD